jgi:hypothetical protein
LARQSDCKPLNQQPEKTQQNLQTLFLSNPESTVLRDLKVRRAGVRFIHVQTRISTQLLLQLIWNFQLADINQFTALAWNRSSGGLGASFLPGYH